MYNQRPYDNKLVKERIKTHKQDYLGSMGMLKMEKLGY